MKNLAEAFQFLHRKNIVHRDLKSDNVVFNKQNNVITCILVDFNKSTYTTSVRRYSLTEEEKQKYRQDHKHIAPDLIDGVSDISTASDMYSYGRMFKNIIVYFPLKPDLISVPVRNAIKQCLKYKDRERPNADHFVQLL